MVQSKWECHALGDNDSAIVNIVRLILKSIKILNGKQAIKNLNFHHCLDVYIHEDDDEWLLANRHNSAIQSRARTYILLKCLAATYLSMKISNDKIMFLYFPKKINMKLRNSEALKFLGCTRPSPRL